LKPAGQNATWQIRVQNHKFKELILFVSTAVWQ
jgi:hypothetical protein